MMQEPQQDAAVVPEQVVDLLEERTRVRTWLDRLGELEDEASPRVYEKVRSDYVGRLEEVSARLAEHRTALEGSLAEHRGRAENLREARAARAAELEEAKIRFEVGEHSEEEWERLRAEAEAAIGDLEGRLESESEAVADLEKVLDGLDSTPLPVGTPGEREAGSPPETASGVGDVGAAGGAGEGSRDEEGFEGRDPGRPDAGSERTEREPAEAAEAEYRDELEFLESLSLDQPDRFDAVSALLEEEEESGSGDERSG